MFHLRYVGSILPKTTAQRFVTSVFRHPVSRRHYIQLQVDNKITGFKKVKLSKSFLRIKSDLRVRIGSPCVYSFCLDEKSIFYGFRSTIEKDLVRILNSPLLNVHSRLMISAFLRLPGKTVQLVDESNQDLLEKGLGQKIELMSFFRTASELARVDQNPTELIRARHDFFKLINKSIRYKDLACIKGDKTYFDNKYFETSALITKDLIGKDVLEEMVGEIVRFCSKKKFIDLRTLLKSDDSYAFLLASKYVNIAQDDVEEILSTTIENSKLRQKKSILEIGIEFDKNMHHSTETTMESRDSSERSLDESFKAITSLA